MVPQKEHVATFSGKATQPWFTIYPNVTAYQYVSHLCHCQRWKVKYANHMGYLIKKGIIRNLLKLPKMYRASHFQVSQWLV